MDVRYFVFRTISYFAILTSLITFRLNEYTKNGNGYQPQHKPRVPKLRRMSAAAFNFLSNNIAPKWLTDKLADGGGDRSHWRDDPKHRLSLNDDYGYGYGSTYNGVVNHTMHNHHSYNPSNVHNEPSGGYNQSHSKPIAAYAPNHQSVQQDVSSSAPDHLRHRRLSSPDPVLAHCANTIAVADFLMTLQRSLDNSSVTAQAASSFFNHSNRSTATMGPNAIRPERRSPLFTLFQDRRPSSSAESWQYSSLTSTVSSSTTAAVVDEQSAPVSLPMQLLPSAITNSVTIKVALPS